MHHKGHLYRSSNIDMLLQQRYNNAQIRKQGGRHKGPPFSKEDKNNLSVHLNLLSNNYRRKNNEAELQYIAVLVKVKTPFMLKKHTNLVNIWLSKAMN